MKITKEQFMDRCKEFEQLVRNIYGIHENQSPYMELARMEGFEQYYDELNVIRIARNTFAHNPTAINGEEVFILKPILYNTLLKIILILKIPPKIYSISTKNIIYATKEETIWDVMVKMKKYTLTQIPILKDRRVIGVFSENTLFLLLMKYKGIYKQTPLEKILPVCQVSRHTNEYYSFVPENEPIPVSKRRFIRNDKKRLVMLFITKNGDSKEPLVGIVTAWDFIKP